VRDTLAPFVAAGRADLLELGYLQAGSHSTADAFTHAADAFFAWARRDPQAADEAHHDLTVLQRCVYETLRLHPASPVAQRRALAPISLRGGTEIPQGAFVVLDLAAANRDPRVFDHPDVYDPLREVPAGIPRWGHAFGGGMHACIGTELAGGVPAPDGPSPEQAHEQVLGTVTLMLDALLTARARPDPDAGPQRDPHSARDHFASYPRSSGSEAAGRGRDRPGWGLHRRGAAGDRRRGGRVRLVLGDRRTRPSSSPGWRRSASGSCPCCGRSDGRFEDRAAIADVMAVHCERVDEYDIDAVAAPRGVGRRQ
jgi:hypothetical protein